MFQIGWKSVFVGWLATNGGNAGNKVFSWLNKRGNFIRHANSISHGLIFTKQELILEAGKTCLASPDTTHLEEAGKNHRVTLHSWSLERQSKKLYSSEERKKQGRYAGLFCVRKGGMFPSHWKQENKLLVLFFIMKFADMLLTELTKLLSLRNKRFTAEIILTCSLSISPLYEERLPVLFFW